MYKAPCRDNLEEEAEGGVLASGLTFCRHCSMLTHSTQASETRARRCRCYDAQWPSLREHESFQFPVARPHRSARLTRQYVSAPGPLINVLSKAHLGEHLHRFALGRFQGAVLDPCGWSPLPTPLAQRRESLLRRSGSHLSPGECLVIMASARQMHACHAPPSLAYACRKEPDGVLTDTATRHGAADPLSAPCLCPQTFRLRS